MISKISDLFQICLSSLSCWRRLSCLSYLTIWTQTHFGLDFSQLTVLVTPLKPLLGVLNDLLTVSDDGQVSLHTLLDLSAAFDTIDHSILFHRLEHALAYRNLLFRSFDPIWPKDSKRYPLLVTVQGPPLSVMVYPLVQFSAPYCFFCTHNHFQKSLTDTQYPILNLPVIASCTTECQLNIFALWLVICSHV